MTTVVVGRVCLDAPRSRKSQRKEPLKEFFGGRLPEPIVSPEDGLSPSTKRSWPTRSVSRCWWYSRRSPAERLAFVVHYEETASIVGRSPTAARQRASRACRRVQGEAPVSEADLATQRKVVDAFLAQQHSCARLERLRVSCR